MERCQHLRMIRQHQTIKFAKSKSLAISSTWMLTQRSNRQALHRLSYGLMRRKGVGRKSWLFVGSAREGVSNARLMTLVTSSYRNDLVVTTYLGRVWSRTCFEERWRLRNCVWMSGRHITRNQYRPRHQNEERQSISKMTQDHLTNTPDKVESIPRNLKRRICTRDLKAAMGLASESRTFGSYFQVFVP